MRFVCAIALLLTVSQWIPAAEIHLAGRVTNKVTGVSVKGALVTLNGFLPRSQRTAITDSQGGFVFQALPQGNYFANVSKPSYEGAAQKPFALNASIDGAVLELSPLGSISGKITDESGEPLVGVDVRVEQSEVFAGRRKTVKSREVPTDDQGVYRVWNLKPGKYFVMAAGRSGGTRLYLGERSPTFDSHECFTPVYNGGSANLQSALAITTKAGSAETANLSLHLQPAYKIRGAVKNFVPYLPAKFELLRDEEDIAASRVSLNAANGKFEIQDVTPGQYRLRVTQGKDNSATQGELLVSMPDRDLDNIAVPLLASVLISIRINGQRELQTRQSSCFPVLDGYPAFQSVGEHGMFPGDHRIQIRCFGTYAASALANGTDLLSTGKLNVPTGSESIAIEVQSASDQAALEVVVAEAKETQAVLIPDGRIGNGPEVMPVVPGITCQFENLAPGDYRVFLFSRNDDTGQSRELEYENPDVVKLWTGGVRVHLGPGAREKVEVTSLSQ